MRINNIYFLGEKIKETAIIRPKISRLCHTGTCSKWRLLLQTKLVKKAIKFVLFCFLKGGGGGGGGGGVFS